VASQSCPKTYLLTNGTSICVLSCPPGTYTSGSNSDECLSCPQTCSQCSGVGNCSACALGYVLSSNNKCNQECLEPTASILNGTCYSPCPSGYYSKVVSALGNSYCLACSVNCLTCNMTSTNCTSCATGQTLSASNTCSSGCTGSCCSAGQFQLAVSGTCAATCPAGYYADSVTTCALCNIAGCATCVQKDRGVTCTTCSQSYLSNGACVLSCPYGQLTDPTGYCMPYSQGCPSGQFLANPSTGTCQLCVAGCANCVLASVLCTTCAGGYFSNNTFGKYVACQACPANCQFCENTSGCTSCFNKFYLSQGSCVSCGLGCGTCTNNSTCSTCVGNATLNSSTSQCQCNSGFFLNESATGVNQQECVMCEESCLTCSKLAINCTACSSSYYLNGSKCQACELSCATCTSMSQCTTCIANAVLNGTKQCNCMPGYLLANASCTRCPGNCSTCYSLTLCTSCQPTFFAQNGTCSACGNHCETCRSSTSCIKCGPGFDLISGTCAKAWRVALISVGIALFMVIVIVLGIYFFKKCIENNTGEED
jgi:hypothetical protein